MSGIEVQREDVAGRVFLRVQGRFDGQAANLLHKMVCSVEADAKVVVDFSQVQDFADLSVGLLTRTLSLRDVQLQGLRTHQERMFQYFGVATVGEDDRAYYTPEDLLVA